MSTFRTLHVMRQDGPMLPARRETFRLPCGDRTVARGLWELALRPVTDEGVHTSPPAFPDACVDLPAPCGGCVAMVDGVPRALCTTRLDSLGDGAVLSPMARFPLVRDLRVDTRAVLHSLMVMQAWAPLDGLEDAPLPPERHSPDRALELQASGACTWCGACLQVCPSALSRGDFQGAAAVLEVLRTLMHPNASSRREPRLALLDSFHGVHGCGQHGACQAACPSGLPLTEHLAASGRRAWHHHRRAGT